MNKSRIIGTMILVAFCCCESLRAQTTWDLEKCVAHAMNENLDLRSSELMLENTRINENQAKHSRYPSLNANSSVGWNFGRTIDPTSNQFITETFFSNNYGLNTGVVLFDGFRIKKNIERSRKDLQASEADLSQAQQDISLQVCLAYLNVLFAKENIRVAQAQNELNKQQIDRISKLIKAGAAPAGDILSLEAQLATSEQGIIVSENALENAILNLEQLLRIDANGETEFLIPDNIEMTTDPDLVTFKDVHEAALQNRYDLIAASLREEIAHKDIEIQKAGNYPTLTFGGNLATNYSNQARAIAGQEKQTISQDFELNGAPVTVTQEIDVPIIIKPGFPDQLETFLSYGFGFGLNIPIYNNGNVKNGVERAKLNLETQKINKVRVMDRLRTNILTTLTDARAAKRKLAASEKNVTAQKLALENIKKRYEVGSANSFDWQNSKANLENAEINLLMDKYDYIFKVKVLEFYQGKPLKI